MLDSTSSDRFDRFCIRETDDVVVLELDRRRRLNAIDERTIEELDEIVAELRADPPGAIVLSSASERAFSVGLDLRTLETDVEYESAVETVRNGQQTMTAFARLESPVVAAIEGHALGGGLELALCADLRVGGTSATFAQPEVDNGLPPGGGATQRLPAIVGEGRAREMLYTGRRYDAETMHRWGLLNEVVDDAVVDRTLELAASLADGPRSVFGAVDRAIRAGATPDESGFEVEAEAFARHLVGESVDGFAEREGQSGERE